MARVNYREVSQRFTHIDARFVASNVGFPEGDSFFSVEFYPWWEHPLYLQARAAGTSWGFKGETKAERVTVYPKQVYEACLSPMEDVIDWAFTQDHPLLWQYEDSFDITCNDPLSLEQWGEITKAAKATLTGHIWEEDLAKYLFWDRVARWGKAGSFSLGRFPRTWFLAIHRELKARSISCSAPGEPEPAELPVLFLVGDSDYIIAADFELDVPEFVHKPEWFQPAQ